MLEDSQPPHTTLAAESAGYDPLSLSEVEQIELLHALSFHFESFIHDVAPECAGDRVLQYEVLKVAVERILRRRAGVA